MERENVKKFIVLHACIPLVIVLTLLFTVRAQSERVEAVGYRDMIEAIRLNAAVPEEMPERNAADGDRPRPFTSEEELNRFLWEQRSDVSHRTVPDFDSSVMRAEGVRSGDTGNYSTTNIQVQGVDEADFVKNDGEYIYVLGRKGLTIVDAVPSVDMSIVSTVPFDTYIDEWGTADAMYVSGDTVTVLVTVYSQRGYETVGEKTNILVYDVSDRKKPVLRHRMSVDGRYVNSRMIGEHVYAVTETTPYFFEGRVRIPRFEPSQRGFPEIYHFPSVREPAYVFTNIVSLHTGSGETDNKAFLLGRSADIFVSRDNLYISYDAYRYGNKTIEEEIADRWNDVFLAELPGSVRAEVRKILGDRSYIDKTAWEIKKEKEAVNKILMDWFGIGELHRMIEVYARTAKNMSGVRSEVKRGERGTIIHKVALNAGAVEYAGNGDVIGRPLNQFSMDEYGGYFRIATTTGSGEKSLNHVFVLDEHMETIGSLENLAEGERIYATRFIGNRLYMVTFVRVDPLFVIDLSVPTDPYVLGELKVPGVSDYLHPFDEKHLIGIGRSTGRSGGDTRPFATFEGVKVSLFDVSDVHNPGEKASYNFGKHGSGTRVTRDHRAFLFDEERGMLVLPVTLMNRERMSPWYGAVVLDISENGIKERGRITHSGRGYGERGEFDDVFRYYYLPPVIRRSLYIGDVLYTVSSAMIKANELESLREIGKVKLPGAGLDDIPIPIPMPNPIPIERIE